ncbi:MAG TPA: hypothetical protein VF995_04475 [Actinomycetota bacterium]
MHQNLGEYLNRSQELAREADSHHSRHLRALRAKRAAELDEALARREWSALLRALTRR